MNWMLLHDADELDADALESSVLDADVDANWGEGYEDTLEAAALDADVASADGDADTRANIPLMLACFALADRRRAPPLERRRAQCIVRILDGPLYAAGVKLTTPRLSPAEVARTSRPSQSASARSS